MIFELTETQKNIVQAAKKISSKFKTCLFAAGANHTELLGITLKIKISFHFSFDEIIFSNHDYISSNPSDYDQPVCSKLGCWSPG